jgi:hypothetical protein
VAAGGAAAGVGTPEQTYGVSCTVFPGNNRDLHGTPWLAKQRRKVEPLNAAAALNVTATCYKYKAQREETVASIVESLDLDYREFIHDNFQQFGKLQNVSYKMAQTKKAAELATILKVVGSITQPYTPVKPYFDCTFYDKDAKESRVTCYADATEPCAQNGTVGCTLHYKDVNVTESLPAGKQNTSGMRSMLCCQHCGGVCCAVSGSLCRQVAHLTAHKHHHP